MGNNRWHRASHECLQFISRPFVVGDRIEISSVGGSKFVVGTVERVDPMRTIIRTDSCMPITIPNKVSPSVLPSDLPLVLPCVLVLMLPFAQVLPLSFALDSLHVAPSPNPAIHRCPSSGPELRFEPKFCHWPLALPWP